MNRHKTDIETQDLGDGIFRLNEYDFANCYLIVGEKSACMIDAGVGVAAVHEIAATLTDKPVTLLLTHGHADHAGGAVWFPEAYVHPADMRSARRNMKFPMRMYFLSCHRYKKKKHGVSYSDALQRAFRTELKPINEGESVDLGGRRIETFFTPGHSKGSLFFRDSRTGAVFTGDNVNLMVTLQYPGAATMKEWADGAKKTLETAGDAPLWGGHGDGRIPRRAVETALALAQPLLEKGNGGGFGTRMEKGAQKFPRIYYKPRRILPRK